MAKPFIKIEERGGVTTITFHALHAKKPLVVKRVHLNNPTREEVKQVVGQALLLLREPPSLQEK